MGVTAVEPHSIGYVEVMVLVSVLAVCWLLGGKVGFGTLLGTFGQGIIMDIVFRILHFEPRNLAQKDLIMTAKALLAEHNMKKAEL